MTASVSATTEEGKMPDVDVLQHLLEVVEKMDPGWAERELKFMPRSLGRAQKQLHEDELD